MAFTFGLMRSIWAMNARTTSVAERAHLPRERPRRGEADFF